MFMMLFFSCVSFAIPIYILSIAFLPFVVKQIEHDLSAQFGLEVYLWRRVGKGRDCICEMRLEDKPHNTSQSELRARAVVGKSRGDLITWHHELPFEVYLCICMI